MQISTYLTTPEAARLVGLSVSSLEKMRVKGDGPPFLKAGRRKVLYSPEALKNWLTEHRSTSEYAA